MSDMHAYLLCNTAHDYKLHLGCFPSSEKNLHFLDVATAILVTFSTNCNHVGLEFISLESLTS